MSIPLASLESYAGSDPRATNPVLVQLLRNLTPGQRPVVRLGGDSADRTWWPVPGMRRPASVEYTLTDRWLRVAREFASTSNARLIVGINLKADSARLARAEAVAMIRGIGSQRIEALELGNEPELYRRFSLREDRRSTRGSRPVTAAFRSFNAEFARVARSLPPIALAGPSIGSDRWSHDLSSFVRTTPELRMVTLHRYPLKRCSPDAEVTAAQLLSPASTDGLARSTAGPAASAGSRSLPLRIDELNTIACGGQPGVSDTFASALWLVDTLPAIARAGVAGVNIHTHPNSFNELFSFEHVGTTWQATVRPEYYGLLLFGEAAPPASRLLTVSGVSGRELRVWATRDANRNVRVVLVNNDGNRGVSVIVRASAAAGSATLTRLQAPGLSATGGVTLGGQSFGPATSTGLLRPSRTPVAPAPSADAYLVRLPPASAAVLELSEPSTGSADEQATVTDTRP